MKIIKPLPKALADPGRVRIGDSGVKPARKGK